MFHSLDIWHKAKSIRKCLAKVNFIDSNCLFQYTFERNIIFSKVFITESVVFQLIIPAQRTLFVMFLFFPNVLDGNTAVQVGTA